MKAEKHQQEPAWDGQAVNRSVDGQITASMAWKAPLVRDFSNQQCVWCEKALRDGARSRAVPSVIRVTIMHPAEGLMRVHGYSCQMCVTRLSDLQVVPSGETAAEHLTVSSPIPFKPREDWWRLAELAKQGGQGAKSTSGTTRKKGAAW